MGKSNGKIIILLIAIASVVAKYLPDGELSQDELKHIQDVLQQLPGLKLNQHHGHHQGHQLSHQHHQNHQRQYHDKSHHDHDGLPNDRTHIQTLNLIFKHNNISPGGYNTDPQNIAKTIAGVTDDIIPWKPAERCGPKQSCKPKKKECRPCGRNGYASEEDETGEENNAAIEGTNLFAINLPNAKAQAESSSPDDYLSKILDDLEKTLVDTNSYQDLNRNTFSVQCDGVTCKIVSQADDGNTDSKNDSAEDNNVKNFLEDLEKSLAQKNTEFKCQGLRCGCNKSKCTCSQVRCDCGNGRCELEDGNTEIANVNKEVSNQNQAFESSVSKSPLKPKVYKINDELDAYVIDASEASELIKLLGNNYVQLQPQNFERGRPKRSTNDGVKNQGKVRSFRRSSNSEIYGLPFELEVEGLGQINP